MPCIYNLETNTMAGNMIVQLVWYIIYIVSFIDRLYGFVFAYMELAVRLPSMSGDRKSVV